MPFRTERRPAGGGASANGRRLEHECEDRSLSIVREGDGLALSSRNVYLSAEERRQALVLSRSLREARAAVEEGRAATTGEVRELLSTIISGSPLADIDYAEILTFPELEPLEGNFPLTEAEGEIIMALAVRFGRTRLIDNIIFTPKEVAALV